MSPENVLYRRGQPADYFIMILEGHARVVVTEENQEYSAGPFCYFGVSALMIEEMEEERSKAENNGGGGGEVTGNGSVGAVQTTTTTTEQETTFTDEEGKEKSSSSSSSFIADFSLYCPEKVLYLKVSRPLYRTALRTTAMERERERERAAISSGKSVENGQTKNAFWNLHTALQPIIFSPLANNNKPQSPKNDKEEGNGKTAGGGGGPDGDHHHSSS